MTVPSRPPQNTIGPTARHNLGQPGFQGAFQQPGVENVYGDMRDILGQRGGGMSLLDWIPLLGQLRGLYQGGQMMQQGHPLMGALVGAASMVPGGKGAGKAVAKIANKVGPEVEAAARALASPGADAGLLAVQFLDEIGYAGQSAAHNDHFFPYAAAKYHELRNRGLTDNRILDLAAAAKKWQFGYKDDQIVNAINRARTFMERFGLTDVVAVPSAGKKVAKGLPKPRSAPNTIRGDK